MSLIESAKKAAAYAAIDAHVSSLTKSIGIGSGSTIAYAVERLSQLNLPSLKACVPTSFQAQQLILQHSLPLVRDQSLMP